MNSLACWCEGCSKQGKKSGTSSKHGSMMDQRGFGRPSHMAPRSSSLSHHRRLYLRGRRYELQKRDIYTGRVRPGNNSGSSPRQIPAPMTWKKFRNEKGNDRGRSRSCEKTSMQDKEVKYKKDKHCLYHGRLEYVTDVNLDSSLLRWQGEKEEYTIIAWA